MCAVAYNQELVFRVTDVILFRFEIHILMIYAGFELTFIAKRWSYCVCLNFSMSHLGSFCSTTNATASAAATTSSNIFYFYFTCPLFPSTWVRLCPLKRSRDCSVVWAEIFIYIFNFCHSTRSLIALKWKDFCALPITVCYIIIKYCVKFVTDNVNVIS